MSNRTEILEELNAIGAWWQKMAADLPEGSVKIESTEKSWHGTIQCRGIVFDFQFTENYYFKTLLKYNDTVIKDDSTFLLYYSNRAVFSLVVEVRHEGRMAIHGPESYDDLLKIIGNYERA